MIHAISTMIIGLMIGYLAQRSRICFIGGITKLYLVKDLYSIRGMLGLFAGALIGFTTFNAIGGYTPSFPLLLRTPGMILKFPWIFAIVGGFGMGFFSAFAGGCPLRLHVMAGEGRGTAVAYLVGFYIGIIYFLMIVRKILAIMIGVIG